MSFWKRLRHRLEAGVCRFFAWWIQSLSRGSCVRLGNALGQIAYLIDGRGRTVGFSNLQCAFPEMPLEKRKEVLQASYRNFIRTMVDLFWSPNLLKPENKKYLRVHGDAEVYRRCAETKKGVVFVSVHAGNWEWTSLACGLHKSGALAVAENFKNPRLTPIITNLRQVTGQIIVPPENCLLRMLRAVKRGGNVALLGDLTVPPSQIATVLRAFGLEMSASVLHAVLAVRGDALVCMSESIPRPDGSVDCYASFIDIPENATLHEISQTCWDRFEASLRKEPGLWLWPYKHFRYRPKDATIPYPFYSNVSKAYEKIRKKELNLPNSN